MSQNLFDDYTQTGEHRILTVLRDSRFVLYGDGSVTVEFVHWVGGKNEGLCQLFGTYTNYQATAYDPVLLALQAEGPIVEFLPDGKYRIGVASVGGNYPTTVHAHLWGTRCTNNGIESFDETQVYITDLSDVTSSFNFDVGTRDPHNGTSLTTLLEGNDHFPNSGYYGGIDYRIRWKLTKASCGDGSVDAGEACDDGNNNDGDGCTSSCHEECAGSNQAVLHAGDHVIVTVRIDSTHVTEDQGHVSLRLSSSNTGAQLHSEITQFGQSQQFTYVVDPQYDNDHIVANWVGPTNGNESCAMTVTTSACLSGKTGNCASPYTYEAKKEAYSAAADGIFAVTSELALEGALISACSACGPECSLACDEGVHASLHLISGAHVAVEVSDVVHESEVGDDPPDANYSELFVPVIPPPPFPGFPISATPGLTAELVQSANALASVGAQLAAHSIAAQRTIQKLAGAYRAGDTVWQAQQAAALTRHERRVAEVIPAYAEGLIDVRAKLSAVVMPSLYVSPDDIDTAKQQLLTAALEPNATQWLLALGTTPLSLEAALAQAQSVDSAVAAGLFPNVMVRENGLDAMLMFAAHVSAPGPMMCYKAQLAPGGAFSGTSMTVGDRFDTATFTLKRPSVVCNIAGLENVDDQLAAPFDDTRHLVGVAVKRARGTARSAGIGTTHTIRNAFQDDLEVLLSKEARLLAASTASAGDQGTIAAANASLDDFKCFKVKSPDAPRFLRGDGVFDDIRDQLAEQGLVVGRPRYLCVPASIGGSELVTRIGALTCYDTKPCSACAKPRFSARDVSQSVANGVTGNAVIKIKSVAELCIPSVLDPPLVP